MACVTEISQVVTGFTLDKPAQKIELALSYRKMATDPGVELRALVGFLDPISADPSGRVVPACITNTRGGFEDSGLSISATVSDQEWAYEGGVWGGRNNVLRPSARVNHAMVADFIRNKVGTAGMPREPPTQL